MKDVPKIVIALDWFELRSQRGDIYKLSKHVKSLFLSSHRPSWHITHPQLQFKCPTKSIPIWRFKCPTKSFQIIKSNFPNLRVPQNISQFFHFRFWNWTFWILLFPAPFSIGHKLIPYLFARSPITTPHHISPITTLLSAGLHTRTDCVKQSQFEGLNVPQNPFWLTNQIRTYCVRLFSKKIIPEILANTE